MALFFHGEATPEEQLRLKTWIQASPENLRVFCQMKKMWESRQVPPLFDAQAAFARLKDKLS